MSSSLARVIPTGGRVVVYGGDRSLCSNDQRDRGLTRAKPKKGGYPALLIDAEIRDVVELREIGPVIGCTNLREA